MPDEKTVEKRTADVIVADMDALLTEVGDADLTDEQVARYEGFERELKARRTRDEITKRHEAVKAAAPGQFVTGAKSKTDNDDELNRAFGAFLRTGRANSDITELRAQSEGTASEGGFLVPEKFRDTLVRRIKAFGGLADVVDEITTGDGTPLSWPTVDDVSNVGEIVQEGNTFSSGADIVFGTANLGAYRYASGGSGSTPIRVSVELLQDAAFDVGALVGSLLAERIGRIQSAHLITGTGVSQPKGIVSGLTGTASAASTLTYDDFVGYIHAVDPAYRNSGNCRFAFNDNTLKLVRKIKDTTGRPLLLGQDDRSLSQNPGGETILGYPVTIDQGFADVAANSTTNWGVFGDLRAGYVVRRVRDVVIAVDPYGRMADGQVQYTAWARMDATQQNTNAYVALTGHS